MGRKLACSVLAIFMAVTFFGCAKGQKAASGQPVIPLAFQTDFTASIGDFEMTGTLTRQAAGVYTLKLHSPDVLKNMEFSYEGEQLKVCYQGLEICLSPSDMPKSSAVSLLVRSMDSMLRVENLKAESAGDSWKYTGNIQQGSFELLQNKKTGAFETFSASPGRCKVVFTKFKTL